MKDHKNSLNVSLGKGQGEGSNFQTELKKVYEAFYQKPKTMKEVDKETGIMRESICWYCKELRSQGKLHPVRKRVCSVTKYDHVTEWTSNPNDIPKSNQLKMF